MKKRKKQYIVTLNGEEIGTTWAVSEAQAKNNMRFNHTVRDYLDGNQTEWTDMEDYRADEIIE